MSAQNYTGERSGAGLVEARNDEQAVSVVGSADGAAKAPPPRLTPASSLVDGLPDTVGANGSEIGCVDVEMDLRRSTMTGPYERLKPAGDCSDGPPCDLRA